jgi:hypothetical protein
VLVRPLTRKKAAAPEIHCCHRQRIALDDFLISLAESIYSLAAQAAHINKGVRELSALIIYRLGGNGAVMWGLLFELFSSQMEYRVIEGLYWVAAA